jgi:hypothetical protein
LFAEGQVATRWKTKSEPVSCATIVLACGLLTRRSLLPDVGGQHAHLGDDLLERPICDKGLTKLLSSYRLSL